MQKEKIKRLDADGLIGDKSNQILWVYTADCIPILLADKQKRFVAAIHCGRKGLEKKIIKNLIKFFVKIGSSKNDLIIALGPSISKKNYFLNEETFKNFYVNIGKKSIIDLEKNTKKHCNNFTSKRENLYQLDLKRNAYMHLINENIPSENIEISNLCTYESVKEFFSYRRTKTKFRQWNFICP